LIVGPSALSTFPLDNLQTSNKASIPKGESQAADNDHQDPEGDDQSFPHAYQPMQIIGTSQVMRRTPFPLFLIVLA
jgi:hypothetical protein